MKNSEEPSTENNSSKICLVVDVTENCTDVWKTSNASQLLKDLKVNYKTQSLKVGDYTWVLTDNDKNEIVLPYIVERKRIDDLSKSLIDGRYHKQKFNMRYSGFPKIIYIIEGCRETHIALSCNTLLQAACSTMVSKGFVVKFTKDYRDTLITLNAIGKRLATKYSGNQLELYKKNGWENAGLSQGSLMENPYNDLKLAITETNKVTISQMMIKQLLIISGMSWEKAENLVNCFPTPRDLASSTQDCSDTNLGPHLASVVNEFYNKNK